MSAVKTVVVLLALALLGSQAAPTGPDCDGLNKTISQDDLHKVSPEHPGQLAATLTGSSKSRGPLLALC